MLNADRYSNKMKSVVFIGGSSLVATIYLYIDDKIFIQLQGYNYILMIKY